MSNVDEFIAHYTSEYYDPAKAHEYYLRTRELKGRQKGVDDPKTKGRNKKTGLGALKTKGKKEAWAYTQKQIAKAKKK